MLVSTFSGHGEGTGVKNPRLKSPFPDIEPRFRGAFSYLDADALYAFKSRGFGGEIGINRWQQSELFSVPSGIVARQMTRVFNLSLALAK